MRLHTVLLVSGYLKGKGGFGESIFIVSFQYNSVELTDLLVMVQVVMFIMAIISLGLIAMFEEAGAGNKLVMTTFLVLGLLL